METNNSEYIKIMSLKPNILLVNLTKFHSEISFVILTSSNTYFERKYFWKRVIILSWLWSIIHQNLIKDLFWNGCRYVETRISWIQILCKKLFLSYRQWMIEQANEIQLWMMHCVLHITWQFYHICYVTFLFSVFFKAVRIIWRH